jgi:hypothetical protein
VNPEVWTFVVTFPAVTAPVAGFSVPVIEPVPENRELECRKSARPVPFVRHGGGHLEREGSCLAVSAERHSGA